ncbi:hypothetical protein FGIG_02988 [Fasciola gigantica]|uniref:Uncharacterized protein n=1 Tax=Fasciola gigantica TaxID=46835 RepID=A0A504Y8P4_FASGI|nr:hypothetical protein FGIG_02988 [Fasciola gigantica]
MTVEEAFSDGLTKEELRQLILSSDLGADETEALAVDYKQQFSDLDGKVLQSDNSRITNLEIYDDLLSEWSASYNELNVILIQYPNKQEKSDEPMSLEEWEMRKRHVYEFIRICDLLRTEHFLIAGIRYGRLDQAQFDLMAKTIRTQINTKEERTTAGLWALIAVVGTLGCRRLSEVIRSVDDKVTDAAERVCLYTGQSTSEAKHMFNMITPFLMPFCRTGNQ